jgi:3-oxoacyl-ACP reductase-like protein
VTRGHGPRAWGGAQRRLVERKELDMGDAAGRLAVVTRAASGIGQAVARRLLVEGARVIAVDINEAGLAPVV